MRRHPGFLIGCVWLCGVAVVLSGCETLRKKFTRPRKKQEPQEEVVLVPRDYSAHPFPNDVLYRQYFIYWKSWNQELITSLNDVAPYKKILDCAEQALINLRKMATYLKDEKARELDTYIQKTQKLKDEIIAAQNMPPARLNSLRYDAERILSSINRNFDSKKMKDFFK